MFRFLEISPFPPFGHLQISFPPVPDKPVDLAEVQLITGVNGTGKTRILCSLAALLGNFGPLQKRLTPNTSFSVSEPDVESKNTELRILAVQIVMPH